MSTPDESAPGLTSPDLVGFVASDTSTKSSTELRCQGTEVVFEDQVYLLQSMWGFERSTILKNGEKICGQSVRTMMIDHN